MANCTVRWRPSGGRGEFEYVPADTLEDRNINLFLEPLDMTIPAEVRGVRAQGKPRLRKLEKDNRKKLHLPQLVMAVARLPEPGREDTKHAVSFPLENKSFVMDAMDFDIIDDDGLVATLAPLRMSVLHSGAKIDLHDRLVAIAADLAGVDKINAEHPTLAAAIRAHGAEIKKGINSISLRKTADAVIELQSSIFGETNAGSVLKLEQISALPETDIEAEFVGKEGRLLTRLHVYKERDRVFSKRVKKFYRDKNDGRLICEGCGADPVAVYGPKGERCIEAHHKVPIEELQPDSVTTVEEMAIVCASCHKVIHSRKPCLTINEVRGLLAEHRSTKL